MENDVKKYYFVREKEYRQKMALDEKERIRAMRENIPERFIKLKNKTEKSNQKESAEEVKMAKELLEICIARYGEDFGRLEYASDSKVEEVYRALNNFIHALEKLEQKENKNSDKSREE